MARHSKSLPKDAFFRPILRDGIALTYDDVRLQTAYSGTMPADVDTSSRFSRNVALKIPIASAAMDTVTESKMAIAMAMLGGIGIIHKSLKRKKQYEEVRRVKLHLNGIIEKPVCVQDNVTIKEVLRMKEKHRYTFDSFPVTNDTGRLVGILTKTDFEFCKDRSLLVHQVMTPKPLYGPASMTPDDAYELMGRRKKKVLPLIHKDGTIAGLYAYMDIDRVKTGEADKYNLDAEGRLVVGAAIGTTPLWLERAVQLAKYADVLVIDTAHGDSKPVYDMLKSLKRKLPGKDVMVGNVSEGESARRLAQAGADGIKVGQGPGSICTTRIIAGIGCPQVTAVYNCSHALRDMDVPVCADGGLQYSGDIPIAIGAGAHSVMMGSMLAGTDESPGDIVFHQGRSWKLYRGMGSLGAMRQNEESRARYRQKNGNVLVPEGIEGRVPHKGPLRDVIEQYVGGMRAGFGYAGVSSVEELRRDARFCRLTEAGKAESHPHDVDLVSEPPNYRR